MRDAPTNLISQLIPFVGLLRHLLLMLQPIDHLEIVLRESMMPQFVHRFFHHRRIVPTDPEHLTHEQFEFTQVVVCRDAFLLLLTFEEACGYLDE